VGGEKDFSFDDLAGWAYYGHHQMIWLRDGWLHLGGLRGPGANVFRSGEKIVVDGGQWTDFAAKVKLRLVNRDGQAGMLFRVQQPAVGYDAQCGYYAGVDTANSRVMLGYMDGKIWHELKSAPLPVAEPEPMTLGVAAMGSRLQVRIRDEVLIDTNDATYLSGSVGLRVVNSHAAFADLHVMPLGHSTAAALSSSSTFFMGN
jgi:hypothetical protein